MPRSPRRIKARGIPRVDSDWIGVLVHEVGNLLAAARMSGHFLGSDVSARERATMSQDVERLTIQAAALLGQIRPLVRGTADRRTRVAVSALLRALENAMDGAVGAERLRIAKGRGLPEVRVDADAVHQVLVGLVTTAAGDSERGTPIRVTARQEGARVVVAVIDAAPPLERSPESARTLRGRELALALADAVLRTMGGRVRLAPRRKGNQIELSLAAVRASNGTRSAARRPRAGRGAPRRP